MKSIEEKDLTPWFPGYMGPARPGVYMQKSGGDDPWRGRNKP